MTSGEWDNIVVGGVWQQVNGQFVGRRGRLIVLTEYSVTLVPEPGLCPCPRKQRRTTMSRMRFYREWTRA